MENRCMYAYRKVCEIIEGEIFESKQLKILDEALKEFFIFSNLCKVSTKYKDIVKEVREYLRYAVQYDFYHNFSLWKYNFDSAGEEVLGIVFVGEEYFVKAKEDMDENSTELYKVSEDYKKYIANQDVVFVLKDIIQDI